jgi:hypothetical protein
MSSYIERLGPARALARVWICLLQNHWWTKKFVASR